MNHRLTGLLLILFSFAGSWAWMDYHDALTKSAVAGQPVCVEIEKGDSLDRISEKLVAQNLAIKPFWFKVIAFVGKTYKKIKTGEYELTPGLTIPEILDQFVQGKTKQYAITFPEGWNIKEILQEIAKNPYLEHELATTGLDGLMAQIGIANKKPANVSGQFFQLNSAPFEETASVPAVTPAHRSGPDSIAPAPAIGPPAPLLSAEGLFFPDTYFFEKHMSDASLLKRAYDKMQSILHQEWLGKAEGLPFKTPYEALILASIVEKETGDKAERPLIAGVFVRRLQRDMLLQTDPTVIYGMGDRFRGNISSDDLKTATPYNTYIIKGLPPTPIAVPGRDAIHAVLHPDNSSHLYFVARGNGTHVFSSTLKEHNQAVAAYQRKKGD